MKRKVIVSHSTNQHSPYLAYAAYKEKLLLKFFVGYYFNKDKAHIKILKKLFGSKLIVKIKQKRYFDGIDFDEKLIVNYPVFHGLKIFLETILKKLSIDSLSLTYKCNVLFDWYISKILDKKKVKENVFIGYLNSSLKSFKLVKSNNGIAILDFATIDFREIQSILIKERELSPEFSADLTNANLPNLNRIHDEMELADFILVPSKFSKLCLTKHGINSEKILILPYGGNFEAISENEFVPSIETNSLKLLYVGQIQQKKGIKYLLEAVEALIDEGLNIELSLAGRIYGDKTNYSKFKAFNHLGYLNRANLRKEMLNNDILILPSLFDSFGLVVLEAMAMGLMPIVSENTGAADCISNDEGYIVQNRNIEMLKEVIKEAYFNRSELNLKRRKAILKSQKYSWDNYYNNFNEIIGKL